jgi:hypothetical protein
MSGGDERAQAQALLVEIEEATREVGILDDAIAALGQPSRPGYPPQFSDPPPSEYSLRTTPKVLLWAMGAMGIVAVLLGLIVFYDEGANQGHSAAPLQASILQPKTIPWMRYRPVDGSLRLDPDLGACDLWMSPVGMTEVECTDSAGPRVIYAGLGASPATGALTRSSLPATRPVQGSSAPWT